MKFFWGGLGFNIYSSLRSHQYRRLIKYLYLELHIVKQEGYRQWSRPWSHARIVEAGRTVGPTGCGRASSDPRKSGTTKDECGVQEGLMRYGWRSLGHPRVTGAARTGRSRQKKAYSQAGRALQRNKSFARLRRRRRRRNCALARSLACCRSSLGRSFSSSLPFWFQTVTASELCLLVRFS